MEKNIKYFFGLLLLAFCIGVTSCKKEPNNTVITGIVLDSVKNKVVANKKVIVVACYWGNFLPVCGNLITSTVTNSKGEFELSFNASDNPLGFEVRAGLDSNYYHSASTSEKITAYKINNVTLYAREIGILKASIKVNNNPFNHMVISSGNSNHTLLSSSIDTTLYFKILPKAENKVIFTVWDTAIGKYRGLIDTLQIGLQDTSLYSKQIMDAQNMPIR